MLNVANPLGGSWYVEALTDRLEAEAEAEAIFARIRELAALAVPSGRHPIGEMTSGILRGIEDGWFTGEIADAAFAYRRALEKGEKKMVGVNVHTGAGADDLEILRIGHEVETEQRAALAERKARRDLAGVGQCPAELGSAARGGGNRVEPMLAAVRAEATSGEVCGVLRREWGVHTEPARF